MGVLSQNCRKGAFHMRKGTKLIPSILQHLVNTETAMITPGK